jgi:hypothetical protein
MRSDKFLLAVLKRTRSVAVFGAGKDATSVSPGRRLEEAVFRMRSARRCRWVASKALRLEWRNCRV